MNRRRTQSGVTLMELLVAITLLSLLSVGMLFAMRVGMDAMGKTNNRVMQNRKVIGVDRILAQQIAGFMPASADCRPAPDAPPSRVPFFQGEPQTMRFVSTYSLQEAARGYPHILEFQVIPGENGVGVTLIVNEFLYSGERSTGASCVGATFDPTTGGQVVLFRPVEAGPQSFVLADKLAACQFSFKEERPPEEPDIWKQKWSGDRPPSAVRVEIRPLEPDPAKLQVSTVVEPLRPNRTPLMIYNDYK